MTKQESFKRRVRERVEKTGERYGAARRALLGGFAESGRTSSSDAPVGRVRVSQPEVNDLAVKRATGHDWDEWCDLIDAWPGRDGGHGAIAAHVAEVYGVGGWWGHGVAVGYERITGRRVVNQMADGTFSAGKTRTVTVDADALRASIIDDGDRNELFPGLETTLRSKPTSKALRVGVAIDGEAMGSVLFSLAPKGDGRVAISLSHDGLPDSAAVERWKQYWADWLAAVDD